jgi:Na+-translocating ferredoxin:NAD+ oxidoreductase RnfG subunit
MAKGDNNVLLANLSGSIGKQLTIKQRGGKTIVSKAQAKREKVSSAKQLEAQEKFADATHYAKRMLEDADMAAVYKAAAKAGQNAYNIALRDAYTAPVIEAIETDNYQGKTGDSIIVRATDDFRVFRVTVAIHSAEGTLLETGNALLGRNGKDWVYTATGDNKAIKGTKLIAMAEDLPGNQTGSELVLA